MAKKFVPKKSVDFSKTKVFIELPTHDHVPMGTSGAVGEVCMVFLPIKCVVKPNPYATEDPRQSPKMLEVLSDNPSQWHFREQERQILGYFLDKPKKGKEIDVFAEIAKLKAIDDLQSKVATTMALNKVGIMPPKPEDLSTPKTDNDEER
jgi:hypothetical protein